MMIHSRSVRGMILLSGCLLFSSALIGQQIVDESAPQPPIWTRTIPQGVSYLYFNGTGSSTDLTSAREAAIGNAMQRIVESRDLDISIETITRLEERMMEGVNSEEYSLEDSFISEITKTGRSDRISGLHLEEEYWRRVNMDGSHRYECWVLLRLPKEGVDPTAILPPPVYGLTPIWQSLLVPGWGQFTKGEPLKGWLFLASEAVLITGAAVTSGLSDDYHRKATESRELDDIEYYDQLADQSYAVSLTCGILALAVHGYNLFDAVTAPGVKLYAADSPGSRLRLTGNPQGMIIQYQITLPG